MPQPLYAQERDLIPIVQEAEWSPGPVVTEVIMKVRRPVFFSESIVTIAMKFTYIMGAFFTKLKFLFHKVFFIMNQLFPP
jgi:hypothetical protein